VRLELFGMARALVGGPHVELEVAEPASLRALLAELANRYPQVVGEVLEARSFTPIEPNLVLLDGRRPADLDDRVSEADRPCLLFLPSGG
jgi:molybdopterin converting factor small subunit